MANTNIIGQSPSELSSEQHHASLNQPEYQATHYFRLFETSNLDGLGSMLNTQTPSTYPLTAMESIRYDTQAEAELPCLLPDWNDPQASFEHDWEEDWAGYIEFNLRSMHSDDYSTPEGFPMLSDQEIDGMFGEAFLQPTLQEAASDTMVIPASWTPKFQFLLPTQP